MRKLFTAATLGLSAVTMAPADAIAQEACETYRVELGDSLRKIATRAFGTDDFSEIYAANRNVIGRDPNIIEVGMLLDMPCPEGQSSAELAPPTDVGNDPNRYRFVTASGYHPYTDEALPGRGIFTALVQKAMIRSETETPHDVVFVNDWDAHHEVLLPSLAVDASFPWARPACEAGIPLSDAEQNACDSYLYSDPVYEIVDAYFGHNGSGYETTSRFIELRGAIICRPEGLPTEHLSRQDLMPPVTDLVRAETAQGCFELLVTDQVDLVSIDNRSGDWAIKQMGLEHEVSENPNLNTIVPLRVAAHQANPESAELISAVNTGLRQMQESGEWFDIISAGLRHFQTEAQTN